MRTFFIWLTGILASAIVGGFIADTVSTNPYSGNGVWGALAGPLIFTCARLWLTQSHPSSTQ
jgi:hypothetical protein